jgi:hypothetical protein
MKRSLISFAVGMVLGAVLGILVSDEDKNRLRKSLNKQAAGLRDAYGKPILETANKVKNFVTESFK